MAPGRTAFPRIIFQEPREVLLKVVRIRPVVGLVELLDTRLARGVGVHLGVETELVGGVVYATTLAVRGYPLKVRVEPQHSRLSNARAVKTGQETAIES